MTLAELRNRFWWLIDDNPTNPLLVSSSTLTAIINDGIRSLAEVIRRVTTIKITVPPLTNRVFLPDNIVRVLRVQWNNEDISPVSNPCELSTDSDGAIVHYMFENLRTVLLNSMPAVAGTLTVTYLAYPTLLTLDTDVPMDIPAEYHETLVSVYARAEYARKMGWMAQFQALMALWESTRTEIGGVITARAYPVRHDEARRWSW